MRLRSSLIPLTFAFNVKRLRSIETMQFKLEYLARWRYFGFCGRPRRFGSNFSSPSCSDSAEDITIAHSYTLPLAFKVCSQNLSASSNAHSIGRSVYYHFSFATKTGPTSEDTGECQIAAATSRGACGVSDCYRSSSDDGFRDNLTK